VIVVFQKGRTLVRDGEGVVLNIDGDDDDPSHKAHAAPSITALSAQIIPPSRR
jgi:hypothetical protein